MKDHHSNELVIIAYDSHEFGKHIDLNQEDDDTIIPLMTIYFLFKQFQ